VIFPLIEIFLPAIHFFSNFIRDGYISFKDLCSLKTFIMRFTKTILLVAVLALTVPTQAQTSSLPPLIDRELFFGPPVIAGGYGGGALSIEFGILEFTWRSIVVLIGLLFVIPAPWALVWYLKWIVTCVHVPGRPNLTFTGSALTVAGWYFGFIVLAIAVALTGLQWLDNLMSIVQFALYWLLIKWLVANLASGGQPLGLSFSGSFWAYLGWNILVVLAIITIIGWAWVEVAQLRWLCRNIQGTRREVVFTGTGLEFLWRSIVAVLASLFIIPIPWMYRWMMRWLASQTVLAERGTQANA